MCRLKWKPNDCMAKGVRWAKCPEDKEFFAPKKLIDRADFFNEVKDLKHPEETVTTEGIQY